jgi:hypothetical protein
MKERGPLFRRFYRNPQKERHMDREHVKGAADKARVLSKKRQARFPVTSNWNQKARWTRQKAIFITPQAM